MVESSRGGLEKYGRVFERRTLLVGMVRLDGRLKRRELVEGS